MHEAPCLQRNTLHITNAKLASLHSTCMTVNGWILHVFLTPCSSVPLLSVYRNVSSFNTLSFTLAYHTHHTYPLNGLSLVLQVCVLVACSPPGSVCLYWISCYVQDKMAYHLHRPSNLSHLQTWRFRRKSLEILPKTGGYTFFRTVIRS